MNRLQGILNVGDDIKNREKVKDLPLGSERQFRLANNKTQEITIKKLTRGKPTMKQEFREMGR